MTATTPPDEPTEGCIIQLPAELSQRLDARIEDTTFETHEEYVTEALDQLLTHMEVDAESSLSSRPQTAPAEAEAVKDQLESLGYL